MKKERELLVWDSGVPESIRVIEHDPETKAEFAKWHKGFKIQCERCGEDVATLDDTRGYSDTSGPWGEVSLKCASCGFAVEIIET